MSDNPPLYPTSHFAGWLAARGIHDLRGTSTIMFGDTPEMAAELGALVARGEKAATAGLLARWIADEGAPPGVGGRYVVHDWHGAPIALIENVSVELKPYREVDYAFAEAEGEGFDSLASWRAAHWEYFSRECERLGQPVSEEMTVVCQRFRLVPTD